MSMNIPTTTGLYEAKIPTSAMLTPPVPAHWVETEVVEHDGELRMRYMGGLWPLTMPDDWRTVNDPS